MTIREIAAIAGVSPAAVSLVINNKKGVSAETRRHIQSIMEECGYVPAPVRRKADRFRLMILKFRAHGIALEENQGLYRVHHRPDRERMQTVRLRPRHVQLRTGHGRDDHPEPDGKPARRRDPDRHRAARGGLRAL